MHRNGKVLTNVAEISNYGFYDDSGTYKKADNTDAADWDSVQGNIPSISGYESKIDDAKIDDITYCDKGISEDDEDYEQVIIKKFDLALRKFITRVNGKLIDESREPEINLESVTELQKSNTAKYFHKKNPIEVKTGDIVTYTIRIYNEAELEGIVKEVTDYLPPGLELVPAGDGTNKSSINKKYGWKETKNSDGSRTVKTTLDSDGLTVPAGGLMKYLSKARGFDEDISIDLQIECRVTSTVNNKVLTNVAEITNYTSEAKDTPNDRDSQGNNVFSDNGINSRIESYYKTKYKESNSDNNYYSGNEDDDDFENIKVTNKFDLALRKFITKINDEPIQSSREPQIKAASIRALTNNNTALYYHAKNPLEVAIGDKITYKLRIYNEGTVDGVVKKVMDCLPTGLELVPVEESSINQKYGWAAGPKYAGAQIVYTNLDSDISVKASNCSIGYEKLANNGTIAEQDKFWVDIEIECYVTDGKIGDILTNVAEIDSYGYMDANKQYIPATSVGAVDIDSRQSSLGVNKGDTYIQKYLDNRDVDSIYNSNPPAIAGEQDDDDFESVEVVGKKCLIKVKKTDTEGNPLKNVKLYYEENNKGKDISTGADGSIIENKLLENIDTDTINTFYITEKESLGGYENLYENIYIKVSYKVNENGELEIIPYKYNSRTTNYALVHRVNGGEDSPVTSNEGKYYDLYFTNLQVEVNNDSSIPEIVVKMYNPKKIEEGSYSLQIKKVNSVTNEAISGVTFKVNNKVSRSNGF